MPSDAQLDLNLLLSRTRGNHSQLLVFKSLLLSVLVPRGGEPDPSKLLEKVEYMRKWSDLQLWRLEAPC